MDLLHIFLNSLLPLKNVSFFDKLDYLNNSGNKTFFIETKGKYYNLKYVLKKKKKDKYEKEIIVGNSNSNMSIIKFKSQ